MFLVLLVYVDDNLLTGSSSDLIDKVIKDLNSAFSLKDLGELHYFLGIEAKTNMDCISLRLNTFLIYLPRIICQTTNHALLLLESVSN